MHLTPHHRLLAFAAALAVLCLQPRSAASQPQMLDSTWTISLFGTTPATTAVEGISVDASGRVYVCAGTGGVFRFDTSGTAILWSSAAGNGQATLPTGETFVPSRDIYANHYIWHVASDGSYAPITSTSPGDGWLWAAVTAGGSLFANVTAGPGVGIYSVNVTSGATAPLFTGGPGPGGVGFWQGLTTSGENVVASGYDGVQYGVWSVAAGTATLVSAAPNLLRGLCTGPDGYYASAGDVSGGQVWKITPGNATLFARYFGQTSSIAYDATRERFYVLDGDGKKVWVIKRAPTATRSVSIGYIKVLYR